MRARLIGSLIMMIAALAAPRAAAEEKDLEAAREAVGMLMDLAGIPSATDDPAGVQRAAGWLRERFEALGFEVTALPGSMASNPVLLAQRRADAGGGDPARTVMFYMHYDTQPPGPSADWESTGGSPFGPRILSGRWSDPGARPIEAGDLTEAAIGTARIYGRGVADDKAPIVMHLSALSRWLGTPAARRIHLKFYLDGEEESGSPNAAAVLRAAGPRLAADLLVLCDGPMDALGRPSIYLGTRGDMHMRLRVRTADASAHSGNYGLLPNAAWALADLIASMKDGRGNVAIDGFLDDVVPPTDAQRRAMREASAAEPAIAAKLGAPRFEGDPSVSYFERLLFSPGLTVNHIEAGRPGNQIPHVAEALIEVRLVPRQDPMKVFEAVKRHVLARQPGATLEFLDGSPADRMDPSDPAVAGAIEAARRAAGGSLLVYPSLGGTLPLLNDFAKAGHRYIGLPLVNFDNDQHVANENLRVAALVEGIRFLERLYQELSAR